jgi:hypothetical protein
MGLPPVSLFYTIFYKLGAKDQPINDDRPCEVLVQTIISVVD